MTISKRQTVGSGLSKDLNRSSAGGGTGSATAKLNCVTNGQWPQRSIFNLGPMESCMDHETASLGRDDGNGSLQNAILPFGANAAATNQLRVAHDFMCAAFALEDPVVSMTGTDTNAHLERRSLKGIKSADGVGGVQSKLKLGTNMSGRCVTENGGATAPVLVWFPSSNAR